MPAPTIVAGSLVTAYAQGTSVTISKPSGLVNGDVIVIAIRAQGLISGELTTIASGFVRGGTLLNQNSSADRPTGIFAKPIPTASAETATTYTFGGWATGRVLAIAFLVRGVTLTDYNDGGNRYYTTASDAPAYSVGAVPSLLIEIATDERIAGQSSVPTTTPPGMTVLLNAQTSGYAIVDNADTTGSRTAMWLGSKILTSTDSTSVAAHPIAWPSDVSAPRGAQMALRGTPGAEVSVIGVPVKTGTGASAFLSYLASNGTTRITPKSLNVWYPSYPTVQSLLASTSGPTIAHRGGSLVYPQMSSYAYDHAVFRGYGVLEFSCGWSSDGVPFGLASQYLDDAIGNTGGTTLPVASMTWAQINAYKNHFNPVSAGVWQPFLRLDDFAAKYAKTHICIIDPKYGFSVQANLNTMFDIMDANGGPTRFIAKFDSSETNALLTTTAIARGYERMNYWGSDTTAMAAQQSRWSIIGALYSDATAMAQANTYGKPSWAAIVPNAAGYATARTNGAKLVMCADPINIPAKSSWN